MTADQGVVRMEVHGAIDLASVVALEHALFAAVASGCSLLVDLSDTSFLCCRGIGALTAARDELERRDAWLRVVGAHRSARRAITLNDLYDLLVADETARA